MRSIPIRELPRTEISHRLNEDLSSERNNNAAQASTVVSHDISPSPVHSGHPCIPENGSMTCSPPGSHQSSSLEALEAPIDDHMNWTPPSPILSTPNISDTSTSSSDSDTPLPSGQSIRLSDFLPLPTSSPGYLTQAHQQAMSHRVTYDKLSPGGAFDPSLYTPVLLHDTLMLPGSLATLLGKDSPLDIQDRLTPARLPSFTLLSHHDSPNIPCLLPSSNPTSSATGLLLLGKGRDARKAIKEHYKPIAKRKRHKVVVEVKVPIPMNQRKSVDEKWRLEARWIEAQIFVSRRGKGEGGTVEWELGKAISGAYEVDDGEMEVVEFWGGVEDLVSEDEGEWEVGDLTLDGKSEWAGDIVWCGHGREADVRRIEW